MAAAAITVSNATLYYGTAAEIVAVSGTKGDVGWASDTNTEYTCDADGANWTITRLNNAAGAAGVFLQTLISGEDQTNDVLVVEQGRFIPQQLAASAASDVLPVGGSGAAGDYLSHVIFPLAVATGVCTIADTDDTITFPVGTPAGVYPMTWTSAGSGFTVNNSANDGTSIICVGRFTP